MTFMKAQVDQDVLIIGCDGVFPSRNCKKTAQGIDFWQGNPDALPADTTIAVAHIDRDRVLLVVAPQLKGVVRDGADGIKLIALNPRRTYTAHNLLAITSDMNLKQLPHSN